LNYAQITVELHIILNFLPQQLVGCMTQYVSYLEKADFTAGFYSVACVVLLCKAADETNYEYLFPNSSEQRK
jgi:hypothetical protein